MLKFLSPVLILLIAFPKLNKTEPPDKITGASQSFCEETPEATKQALNLLNSKFAQPNQADASIKRELFSAETFNRALDSVGLGRGTITIKSTQRNEHWQIMIGSKTERNQPTKTRSNNFENQSKRATREVVSDPDLALSSQADPSALTNSAASGPFKHLKHFDFDHHPNYLCLDSHSLRKKYSPRNPDWIGYDEFMFMCPEILNQLAQLACIHHTVDIEFLQRSLSNEVEEHSVVAKLIWGLVSALLIGTVSLIASLFLKLYLSRQKEDLSSRKSYKRTIAFFISLAIGTLTGDSFLHLIPESLQSQTHDDLIKRVIVIPLTIFLLYFLEKFIEIMRARHDRENISVQLIRNFATSSAPEPSRTDINVKNPCVKLVKSVDDFREHFQSFSSHNPMLDSKLGAEANVMFTANDFSVVDFGSEHSRKITPSSDEPNFSGPEIQMVANLKTPRSQNHHHGSHSHSHGSSKSIMVFLGDAFHNIIDGVAIGSAYSSSLLDGLSTSVAVALHEVPHEIGDFVVLVNNGIEINLVFKYAILSNILSLIGVAIGLFIGTSAMDSNYVLCVAAGCFIYVAMINMLPNAVGWDYAEKRDGENLVKCVCHLLGLVAGMVIMALIAFHESKISDGLQYVL